MKSPPPTQFYSLSPPNGERARVRGSFTWSVLRPFCLCSFVFHRHFSDSIPDAVLTRGRIGWAVICAHLCSSVAKFPLSRFPAFRFLPVNFAVKILDSFNFGHRRSRLVTFGHLFPGFATHPDHN